MAEEDLIFGKNRHLFGGLEPPNMRQFTVNVDEARSKYTLVCGLPSPTTVEGQTLCTVAGAIIRKRSDRFPKDEFDGELVADVKSSCIITDTTADFETGYYYAAFPYSDQGVFNRNSVNRTISRPPIPLLGISANMTVIDDTSAKVTLEFHKPIGIYKIVVRRSEIGYPTTENDGDLVAEINATGETKRFYTTTDTVPRNRYFYYTAFPYNRVNIISYDPVNRKSISTERMYLYGFDINNADSNPDTRVSYPADVDNRDFTAAKMNFTTDTFSYGNWPSMAGEKFMPRPCMLNYNGTVAYYLDPNDYTKKIDGTASDITKTGFGGNAMMEWPKIYTKRWEENGIYHFRCSDVKIDDDYECWCNYDRKNNEIDHFYTSIYNTVYSSSRLRSLSGYRPTEGWSFTENITYATNNGADWYIEVVSDLFLFQDLLVMMFKSTDLQTALGMGNSNGTLITINGTMNTKGLFWGSSSNTSGVKAFGMEHRWGNKNRWCAGWFYDSGVCKIKITRGTKDGSTVTNYNSTGAGYLVIPDAPGSLNNYVKKFNTKSFGRLPHTGTGSATTYESDFVRILNDDFYILTVGGHWLMPDSGSWQGPFHMLFTAVIGMGYDTTVVSLSCKPSKT